SKRFIVYLAVGVVCAAVDIGLMKLLMFNGVNYLIAATVGFVAGLILNFFLHTWVTFNAQYSHSAFGRYLVVVFANYILTLISIAVFQYLVDMPVLRSEERRVGKECRDRWWEDQLRRLVE